MSSQKSLSSQLFWLGILGGGSYIAYLNWRDRPSAWFKPLIPIPKTDSTEGFAYIMPESGLVVAPKDIPNFAFVPIDKGTGIFAIKPWFPT